MKRAIGRRLMMGLALALFVASCASVPPRTFTENQVARTDPEWEVINSKVSDIFARMRSNQIGEPYDVRRITSKKSITYRCRAVALVSGRGRPYRFFFDRDLKVREFAPVDLRLDTGIGSDSVKEKETRDALTKAVKDIGEYLGLTYYEGPFIQAIPDSSYLVIFYSIPKETINKYMKEGRRVIDPYVSFLVTEDKTVFGAFRGS